MELELATRDEGEQTIVEITGEIDVYTAPQLRELLSGLIADGRYHLIVDMAKVSFIDSTGLGVLVGFMKDVRDREGSLALANSQEQVVKILRITGLTTVFPLHDSVAAAQLAGHHTTE